MQAQNDPHTPSKPPLLLTSQVHASRKAAFDMEKADGVQIRRVDAPSAAGNAETTSNAEAANAEAAHAEVAHTFSWSLLLRGSKTTNPLGEKMIQDPKVSAVVSCDRIDICHSHEPLVMQPDSRPCPSPPRQQISSRLKLSNVPFLSFLYRCSANERSLSPQLSMPSIECRTHAPRCFLVYSDKGHGSFFIHWSYVPVVGAISWYEPKEIPSKAELGKGVVELCRNLDSSPSRFYESWITYVRSAKVQYLATDPVLPTPLTLSHIRIHTTQIERPRSLVFNWLSHASSLPSHLRASGPILCCFADRRRHTRSPCKH